MPLDLVTVERVDKMATAKAGCFSYTVTVNTIEERPRHLCVQTASDWKASLCEECIESKRGLWIGSRETRYGLDIVTVALDHAKWTDDES